MRATRVKNQAVATSCFVVILITVSFVSGADVDSNQKSPPSSSANVVEAQAEGRKLFDNFDMLAYKENMIHKKISYLFSLIPRPNIGYYPPYHYAPSVAQQPVVGPAGTGQYPAGVVPPYYPAYKPPVAYPTVVGPGGYYPGVQQPIGYPSGVIPGGRPPFYLPVVAEPSPVVTNGNNNNSNNNNNKPVPCNNTCNNGGAAASSSSGSSSASEPQPSAVASESSASSSETIGAEEVKKEPKVVKMMPKSFNLN